MSADNLLSRLDGVKRTGPDRHLAKCPSHNDRTASLSVRELDDGRTLVHCFAGCSVHEVVGAVGLTLGDLFPPRAIDHRCGPERRPFACADAFRAVSFESTIVALAGAAVARGDALNEADKTRLLTAVGRIQSALDAAGVTS